MSNSKKVPPKIELIFNNSNPGRELTLQELERVLEWLFKDEQLLYLLGFVKRYLGHHATKEDVEDLLQNFFTGLHHSVIKIFDPIKKNRLGKYLSFWEYLLVCLKNKCSKERERIRMRNENLISISPKTEDNDDNRGKFELKLFDSDENPQERLLKREEREILIKRINKLKLADQIILYMAYTEGKKDKEIAAELQILDVLQMKYGIVKEEGFNKEISTNSIKVRRFRALQQLRKMPELVEYFERRN